MSFRDCVVCETNSHTQHYCEVDGYEYVECGQCGLVYIDKLEKTENIYKAYSGGGLKSLRRRLMSPFRKFHQDRSFDYSVERAQRIFSYAAGRVDTRGKYLDIGCNKCYLLAQGLDKGWDVYGCELVPELTAPFLNTYKQCRSNVHQGRFMDMRPKFTNDTFELITAIDVIEHFEDVVTDLRGIYEILKPGGAFVIQTPDIACEEAKRLKGKWGALKPLEHLHLFDLQNLTTMAKKVGFSGVEGTDEIFEEADGNFVAILRK
ncbi:class I SAM-dependent methyltransferase [Pseudomonadota bacterium]